MKRYKRSQLNAISVSYTSKANKEAHERINNGGITDTAIKGLKHRFGLKTNSYVVLERAFIGRGMLWPI